MMMTTRYGGKIRKTGGDSPVENQLGGKEGGKEKGGKGREKERERERERERSGGHQAT